MTKMDLILRYARGHTVGHLLTHGGNVVSDIFIVYPTTLATTNPNIKSYKGIPVVFYKNL